MIFVKFELVANDRYSTEGICLAIQEAETIDQPARMVGNIDSRNADHGQDVRDRYFAQVQTAGGAT